VSNNSSSVARGLRRARRVAVVAAALGVFLPAPLGAQGQGSSAPAGWVFTPGISVSEAWDNNVLLATEGNDTFDDFFTSVTPHGALSFRGRLTTFQVDYRGSFQLYQELSDLNAFDQRASASFRQRLSPTVSLFARNSLSRSPSTDEVDLPGVLFRRQGVIINDFRAGVDSRFSARSSMTAAYVFQWINFDDEHLNPPSSFLDRSGHAHGLEADYAYVFSPRLTLGAEYDLRHANTGGVRAFDTQNAMGTADYRLSPHYSLSGGAGLSWLRTNLSDQRQAAPAFRISLERSGARFAWNVGYRKSFLPSVGFGGTFQNQEFHAGFFTPLTRRVDLSGSFSMVENDALRTSELGLRSTWLRSSVSWAAARYLRVEGFYMAAFQNSQRPGGRVNRNRIGVQVVTSTRMRVR
jgi:hypothetical protein